MLKAIGAAAAALILATACGPQGRGTLSPLEGDAFLGAPDAKVTVIEYGAPTCPGCKSWHSQNWAQLKSAYVDTNKIKFIFREFPSHNPPVDAAIFSLARCAGTTDWFPLIDEAFARQEDIELASRSADGPQKALISLGAKFRLSEEQVKACIKDPKNLQRIISSQEEGYARGVNATPTFLINDVQMEDASFASLSGRIDALLSGAAPPVQAPAAAPAEHEHAPGEQH